jgi:hypothetical protein
MKRIFLLMVVLLLSVGTASATIEKWTAGWDNFSEPLDFAHSNITWSVVAATRKLTVTYKLVHRFPIARPNIRNGGCGHRALTP